MKKKIQVILLEDTPSLGSAGQVVTVAEGYARNFLFPQGKAALAIEAAGQQAAAQRTSKKQAAQRQLTAAQSQAESLAGTELTLTAKVKEGEGDELYGSITAAQIAKQLNTEASLKLKASDIVLDKPLTTLGSYDIAVKLSRDVETTIRVIIVPELKDLAHADKQEKT